MTQVQSLRPTSWKKKKPQLLRARVHVHIEACERMRVYTHTHIYMGWGDRSYSFPIENLNDCFCFSLNYSLLSCFYLPPVGTFWFSYAMLKVFFWFPAGIGREAEHLGVVGCSNWIVALMPTFFLKMFYLFFENLVECILIRFFPLPLVSTSSRSAP